MGTASDNAGTLRNTVTSERTTTPRLWNGREIMSRVRQPMTKFQLIRTCVLLVVEAAGAGLLFTRLVYPYLDTHRPSTTPATPPFIYALTWIFVLALAAVLIIVNIRSYT